QDVDSHLPPAACSPCRPLALRWQGRRWPSAAALNGHRAIAPVRLETLSGPNAAHVECDGSRYRFDVEVLPLVPRLSPIKHRGRRGKVELKVHRRFGKPPPDRVRREGRALARAFRKATPKRLWSKQFLRPAAGVDTSAFGVTRIFRGVRSTHEGVDIAGGATDTVYAANDGRVLIVADDFFFIGNTVVLDHGEGLLTLYFHLDATTVREGEMLKRGDVLGTIGQTGRVTGPHLHFGVRYWGRYVDPNDMLRFVPDAPLPGALVGELLTPDAGSSVEVAHSPR
ncbi:MAG: M23 family metallopeptidase, partial [Myxococcota bacterium]